MTEESAKVVSKRKGCSTNRENLDHSFEIQSRCTETCTGTFVGGYTRRVTPVPIPNTVVKPAGPMILLQRESRSLPALFKGTPVLLRTGVLFLRLPSKILPRGRGTYLTAREDPWEGFEATAG